MSEDYNLKPAQLKAIHELEQFINKPIRVLKKVSWNSTGMKIENRNVIQLSLYKMGMKVLPEVIGKLTSLQILKLRDNELTDLPESFEKLKKIEKLDLINNNFSIYPKVKKLKSLKELDLRNNLISELPKIPDHGYDHYLSGNDLLCEEDKIILKDLEDQIKRPIQWVEELELSTRWSKFKGVIVENRKIIGLSLNNCKIGHLRDSFANLNSLTLLDLSYNAFKDFPEQVLELKSLNLLHMRWSMVEKIPDSIERLKSLQYLDLAQNKLEELPEAIGYLDNLVEFRLERNHLKTLPITFGNLQHLEILILSSNKLEYLPKTFGQLKNLKKLSLGGFFESTNENSIWDELLERITSQDREKKSFNNLKELPESFKNLKSLEIFICRYNRLIKLPNDIGKLTSLKTLDLKDNSLKELPESIGNLRSLEKLDLSNNKLKEIPWNIGQLRNLGTAEFDANPWSDIWKGLIKKDIKSLLEYCRRQISLEIFISHTVDDYKPLRIKELAEFLEEKEQIHKAYICEEDLVGNIDWFMSEVIPQCNLILFMATKRSVFESPECGDELLIARRHHIQIIPIKGTDITWKDLNRLDLSREIGLEFDLDNFNTFCADLYDIILRFKQNIDLIDKEREKVDKVKLELVNIFDQYLKSESFENALYSALGDFDTLKEKFKAKEIEFTDFLTEFTNLLNQ